MSHLRLVLLLLAVMVVLAPQLIAADLTLTFDADSVTVRGATPGKQVIAFGIGIGSHGTVALLTRHVEAKADEDGDGVVTFEPRRLPARSVWFAVDFETGAHAVASPEGPVQARLNVSSEEWRGNRAHLDVPRAYVEFLLVRPRKGAWSRRMSEGGPHDDDGQGNGVSRLRLDSTDLLIGTEKGPPFAVPGDLIIALDPQTLDYFVSEAR